MNLNSFKRTSPSGKTIQFHTPRVEQAPSYPSAYFKTHDVKPPISVAVNSAAAFPSSTDHVNLALNGKAEPDAKMLAAFLYESALRFPEKELQADWISYTIKIGSAKDMMTPMDLLTRENADAIPVTKDKTMGEDDWKGPFYKLCAAYRMKKVRESSDTSYTSGMGSKLLALGKSCLETGNAQHSGHCEV